MYDAWETQAIYIESFMAKQLPLSQIEKEEAILCLKNLHDKTEKIYDKIRNGLQGMKLVRKWTNVMP